MIHLLLQKHPSKGVLIKKCSENMLQIYKRKPTPKCDFNKVVKQLYRNHTSTCLFFWKFTVYFQNTFSLEHLWRTASETLLVKTLMKTLLVIESGTTN